MKQGSDPALPLAVKHPFLPILVQEQCLHVEAPRVSRPSSHFVHVVQVKSLRRLQQWRLKNETKTLAELRATPKKYERQSREREGNTTGPGERGNRELQTSDRTLKAQWNKGILSQDRHTQTQLCTG